MILVACVLLGACAEQREEIIETNVPLYMEAGAPSAAPSGSGSVVTDGHDL
jgi:hypothetical protein